MRMCRFRRVRVAADGDCFYHALAYALLRIDHREYASTDMRNRVAARLMQQGMHDAARRARKRGMWAEHEEVGAAAVAFGVHIRVWEGVNNMWVSFGESTHPDVLLYNAHNAHFEPLVCLS